MRSIKFKQGDKVVPSEPRDASPIYEDLHNWMVYRKYLVVADVNSYTGQVGVLPYGTQVLYVPMCCFEKYKETSFLPEELFIL